MKNFRVSLLTIAIAIGIIFSSCGAKDADIEKAVNEKLQTNADYAGITASVADGVVTLGGNCATAGCDASATDFIKAVTGVKEVKSNVTVTPPPPPPVEISADNALQTAVIDALSTYKGITASISDGVVTLTGKIKRADLQPLMMKLNSLKPKKIENKLTIE